MFFNGSTFWLFKEVVFIVFFILLQVLRYTHAAPFRHLFNETSLGQSTNRLYPTIFSFPLASVLRKSIALHSLWFLNSVQHSMPEMFQRVVHILLIIFPGVASLVPGYSRAAAASLGMWHLHVHNNNNNNNIQYLYCAFSIKILKSASTSTWAKLSSGNFSLLGIVIGYICSSSVYDMNVI